MNTFDTDLIATTRAALDWWTALSQGPTSSITGSGAIAHLEREFGERVDGRPCLAVSSGTAALAAALIGVGVLPGDDVLCCAYDWPATTDAVTRIGARVRYATPDRNTLTLDPDQLASRITPNTTAIVATHQYGIPADVPALLKLAADHKIPVVEDAAQAFGAHLDGRPIGALGDAAAFSFGPGKPIDAGEGGIAVFSTIAAWKRALATTQHPVRQLLAGLDPSGPTHSARISPISAIVASYELERHDAPRARQSWRSLCDSVVAAGYEPLTDDPRREPAATAVIVKRANHEPLFSTAPFMLSELDGRWLSPDPAPLWLHDRAVVVPSSFAHRLPMMIRQPMT